MKDKSKIITVACLSGMIILLILTLVAKIVYLSPKNQEQTIIEFAYNHLIEKYSNDKQESKATDGKYTTTSLFKDGRELIIIGEFNIENDNLIHLCITDGVKKLDVNDKNITKSYLKENAIFKRTTSNCKLND